jgi:hypothetical protein
VAGVSMVCRYRRRRTAPQRCAAGGSQRPCSRS